MLQTLLCGGDGTSALAGVDIGIIPTQAEGGAGRRDDPEQRGRADDERCHMVIVGTAALSGRFGAPPGADEFGGPGGLELTAVGLGSQFIQPELTCN